MSFTDEYNALKKKRKKENTTSFEAEYEKLKAETEEEKITLPSPIGKDKITAGLPKKKEEERSWFQKGAFEDGYQFGDVTKTILGTITDTRENLAAGVLGIGEKVVDAGAYLAGGVGGLFGADKFQEKTKEFIAKDLYDEKKIAKKIIGIDTMSQKIAGIDSGDSVFGEKTDSLVESGGQLLGTIGLQAAGVPWFVTSGVTSFGGEAENAFNQGASYGEAGVSAAISAGAELLTEKMFGGSGLGEKGLINLDGLTKGISSKLWKALADYGVDMAAEGAEEVFSQVASNLGSALYKEENLNDILFSEEAIDGYIESFIGGAALGGFANVGKVTNSIQTGKDYRSGMTDNEQKVFDKVYENEVAQAEKDGKLTEKEKAAIYDRVMEDMEKGYISTDTIEEVLGDKSSFDALSKEAEEFDTLYNTAGGQLSKAQQDRLAELEAKNKANPYKELLKSEKDKFSKGVAEMVKGDRLVQSYLENDRKYQDFQADYDKFKGAKHSDAVKKTLENAIKAGANNTNRVHDIVDFAAKVSGDTGKVFIFQSDEQSKADFIERHTKLIQELEGLENRNDAQNKKLTDLKDLLEKVKSGKVKVNGNIVNDEIVLNLSAGKPLNRVVGHEITHSFEPKKGKTSKEYTALKDALYSYAKAKKIDLDKKKAEYQLQYEGLNADAEAEMIADMVGDFLFDSTDFVSHLSVNKNVFQKIWDEVKYLCKIATKGSKEARELEKVKRAFEKAYRAEKTVEEIDADVDDVQYSVSVKDENTLDFLNEQLSRGEYDAETNPDGGYYVTYKSMSFWGYDEHGNAILRSPMAEYVDGKLSNAYLVPKDKSKLNWYEATETIDEKTGLPTGLMVKVKKPGNKSYSYVPAAENQHLIAEDWSNLYFNLKKKVLKNGKWEDSNVPARYNPYEHSSNSMLNDQFSSAYLRDNLVTVKMYVPVSEDNGTYRAQWSKDATGWADWKTGTVAGKINQQKDLQRRVYLSRYAAPVEIVPDSEVAQAYKEYLDGTDVSIPDNVVSPGLLSELKKAGVPTTESGLVKYSISPETDTAYMDAVKRGDTDVAQKMVDDAAKKAGYEHRMFHETDAANIHVFDIARGDHGATDYETPYGIFTKTSAKNIGLGSRQMALFVKAQNTLHVEDRADVRKKIPGFEQYYNQIQEIDSKYDAIAEQLEDEEFDALREWMEENPDADMDVVYPTSYIVEGKPADIDSERYQEVHRKYQENKAEWTQAYDAVAVKAKEFITNYLRGHNYDSMYFKVDGGSRGRQTDSLIVLDTNQVKSADAVTYDDNGNVIPLSERFNAKNEDIRYSLSSMANTFFGDENMSSEEFTKKDYKQTQGYKDYVEQCLNNHRQTKADFAEREADYRKEIEDSIEGIVQVAIAAKQAGYDIYDDKRKRNIRDSKNRLLFSSLEPNSEYTTSNDISTICDKRKNFAQIYDDIVRAEEAKGVPAGKRFFDNVDNYFYLHKLMADKGLTQPCRQCYVESMRKNLAPMANAFLRLVKETNPNNTANDQLYQQSGKNKGQQKVNNAATREWVLDKLASYDMTANDLTVETLTTADGLAQLKIQAPLVYEAFNSFYGQSKPKMPKGATPFRFGELTALLTDEKGNIKKGLVDKINSTGGYRLQSYSDFQIQNFTDVLQSIFEAGTLGLRGHAYTKVPAFLDATAGTNLKRNISIFMYKDGDEWKLDKNDSFPYDLEQIYDIVKKDESGNTGIIAVSQNADMSAWIMANDLVGYGIPFHKSGMKMGTVRDTDVWTDDGRIIKGYSGTIDHTKQQTEVWAKATDDHKALTKVKNGINIYRFWDFDNKGNLSKNELIRKNVEAYIDQCELAGYLPKFRAYVMNNGKVLNDVLKYSKEMGFVSEDATIEDISFQYKGYTIPYGYYKFLGDFGMFTPDGKASSQEVLSLKNYDFEAAKKFFADAEGLRRNEILQQFANGEERQKYRDSDLTAEQLQEIVKQRRSEIAESVSSRYAASLSVNEGFTPVGPREMTGEGFYKEIAPVAQPKPQTNEAVSQTNVAPVAREITPSVLYNKRDGKKGWGKVYATAQEALNDAVRNADRELWDAFNEEVNNTPQNKPLPRGSMPITNALIAVQEDVRQETITPMQGAQLLSEAYASGGVGALRGLYNPNTGNLWDRYLEKAKQYETVAPVAKNAVDVAKNDTSANVPMDDAQLRENLQSITDEDAPAESETYYGEEAPIAPADPFEGRDFKGVGKQNVKAYMFENPEVKPFFQMQAEAMLGDLRNSVKGQKWYNDEVYYQSSGEAGWGGTQRQTTDDIAYLLDMGYTYAQIEKGLNAIIEDHGAENIAMAKRIEFALNERLMKGYTDINGYEIPPNEEYLNLLAQKEAATAMESQIAPHTDADAPMEDIAPVKGYEAIKPKSSNEPRMVRADSKGKRRKWVGTSTESEAVDGKVLPKDLDPELIHYQPISNKKTLGNANAKLGRLGYEDSVKYLNSQFANNKVSLDDIALGERLIQEAVKKGDYKTAGDLIMDISILGTELGQKVQALSIIKRLTPEGQLKMLQKTVERGKAKGDKAYEGVEITQDMIDYILKTYGKDGSYDQDELNKAVEDVKQQIADQMSVSALDKINAWRYLSMLGNPKTHIRNIVSNAAMWGTRQVKNVVARTIEDIAPIKNRTKTWQSATDAVKAYAQKATIEEYEANNESKYSDDGSIKAKRQIFGSKVVDRMANINSDALSKEDTFFSKPVYRSSLAEFLTANGIRTEEDIQKNGKLVAQAKKYAMDQAKEATFQQDSYIASKISEIERRSPLWNIAVGSVLPFKKTPINIAKTAAAYSPLGFARNIYDAVQVKNGDMDASEAVDHLAQTLTGTSLTLIGYMLAQAGILNGAGDDDKEGKYDYQLGKQSYSFNFNGDTYSLSWLSPVAMPLFVGANAYEQLVEGKEWNGDVVVETLAQTLDPLSEMSFLSSLDSVLSSYDSGIQKFVGIFETAAQNYITQFVPTLSSQIATVLDDTKRSTQVAADSGFKFGDRVLNQIKYKIPGLRQTLEPSTDIWGNENKQTENFPLRGVESFLAPWSKREDITTAVDEEIKSLYGEIGDGGVLPAIPSNAINYDGVKYEMSAGEYTQYKKDYGQIAYETLADLFDTSTYQNADSETRRDMVKMVYDYARDEARRMFFDGRDVDFTNATEDDVEVYKENSIVGAIQADLPVAEYQFSQEYPEKYQFFKENDMYNAYASADEEGKRAYNWAFDNPGKYTMSKAVADDFITFYRYRGELFDLEGEKDENGKTISGTKKAAVIDYINDMDLDYGQKIILFRSMYDSKQDKADYNMDIIDYLNSREDISYDEMETILKELGFHVDSEGNITWD